MIKFIKRLIEKIKRKWRIRKKMRQLKKRDPFIYHH